jgi:hypothetical protein
VLCKHEVTGSIPVSSTKTHSSYELFPVCRHTERDSNPEAGLPDGTIAGEQVSRASGLGFSVNGGAWMFDNDWIG